VRDSNPSSLNAGSARIDHVINSKLNLFGRYNYAFSDSSQRGPVFASTHVLSSTTSFSSPVQTFTTGLTALITPSITNELRANYSNQRVTGRSALDGFGGDVPLPDSLLFLPGYSSANGAFFFYIVGAGEYVQGLQGVDEQRQVNLIDNVSILRAGHQIKAGVDYRWLAPFTIPYSYVRANALGRSSQRECSRISRAGRRRIQGTGSPRPRRSLSHRIRGAAERVPPRSRQADRSGDPLRPAPASVAGAGPRTRQ